MLVSRTFAAVEADQGTPAWLTRSRSLWSLVGLTVVISLPYAFMGPGFFIDDWFALRTARFEGWYMAAGPDQWRARPGAGATYAATFGLLGHRPLAHYVIATCLVALTAVLIFVVFERLTGRSAALLLAGLWVVIPNHTSLQMWPSAMNISFALVLVLAGLAFALHRTPSVGGDLLVGLLLGAGVLFYEAVAPAGLLGVAYIGLRLRSDAAERWRLVVVGAGAIGASCAWMLLNWPAEKSPKTWISVSQIVPAHVGYGVFGTTPTGRLIALGVLVGFAVVIGRAVLGRGWHDDRAGRLIVFGAVIVIAGALPFIRYFYAPVGFGDRVMVVSAIGGASMLAGAALELRAAAPKLALVVIPLCLVSALHWRSVLVTDYAAAADQSRAVLEDVRSRFPEPPKDPLLFRVEPDFENNIGPFLQMNWPIEWLYDDPAVTAETTDDDAVFEQFEPRRRFDVRSYAEDRVLVLQRPRSGVRRLAPCSQQAAPEIPS